MPYCYITCIATLPSGGYMYDLPFMALEAIGVFRLFVLILLAQKIQFLKMHVYFPPYVRVIVQEFNSISLCQETKTIFSEYNHN